MRRTVGDCNEELVENAAGILCDCHERRTRAFNLSSNGTGPAASRSAAAAQQPPQPAPPQLGQAELENLVAPIALYPDDLVAQILTASTYPIEVVQAERWVSTHRNIHGDALQDAMQQEPWDASVKGLAA